MQQLTGFEHRALRKPQTDRHKTIVIADDGREAAVVVLDGDQSTSNGSIFEHHGRSWVIKGSRHDSRVLVAEPVVGMSH